MNLKQKYKEQISKEHCNFTAVVVLFFFIFHLITTPITFTDKWHCPMENGGFYSKAMMHMQHMNSMMLMKNAVMIMDENMMPQGMYSHSEQKGALYCPFCSIFWLPISIVSYDPVLPLVLISIITYLYQKYVMQIPLVFHIKANFARPPPFYEIIS